MLGRTPLHYAASLGRVSCIRAMLEGWGGHQARWVLPPPNKPTTALVDAATPAGCTPLHYAVWGNHKAVIQVGRGGGLAGGPLWRGDGGGVPVVVADVCHHLHSSCAVLGCVPGGSVSWLGVLQPCTWMCVRPLSVELC